VKNVFVGVQSDLRPIAKSLKAYLAKLEPFDRCIVRAPFGLDTSLDRPLQFDSVEKYFGDHLDAGDDPRVTLFIGAPDLVPINYWTDISDVIFQMRKLCSSICFEAMAQWNAQFRFACECCSIAEFSSVMVEGILPASAPSNVEILLRAQRYAHRLPEIDAEISRHVILRETDATKYAGVFRGRFGRGIETTDQLQEKLEATGAVVYRYPS